jgi:acyl-coenzyme A synthetase/AMP-(fatty) acid ligase
VPALWRTWQAAKAIPTNVKLAISAGAPLPTALEDAVFAEYRLKIHNFYGSSECGGIAFDNWAVPRSDPCLVGAPMKNVGVSLAADGCLEVRSRAVAETYWPEPEANLRQGVFKTSDLGEICEGLVYLRGRATDQINVAGRKVAPETIEASLSKHPRVSACLVFGVPSAEAGRGETIVACVSASAPVTIEELRQSLASQLPAWHVPREWWFVPDMDANARGKTPRSEWRERYLRAKGRG